MNELVYPGGLRHGVKTWYRRMVPLRDRGFQRSLSTHMQLLQLVNDAREAHATS